MVSALMELTFACMNGSYYYFELFIIFWESIKIDVWSYFSRRLKTSERQNTCMWNIKYNGVVYVGLKGHVFGAVRP